MRTREEIEPMLNNYKEELSDFKKNPDIYKESIGKYEVLISMLEWVLSDKQGD